MGFYRLIVYIKQYQQNENIEINKIYDGKIFKNKILNIIEKYRKYLNDNEKIDNQIMTNLTIIEQIIKLNEYI